MQKKLDITTIKKMSGLIAGNYKTSFRGMGIEFEDLRNYTLGDDIRNIDWNSSAKTGNLLIKKYEEERECSTIFIADCHAGMHFGSGEKRKIDTLSEILLTLAFSASSGGDALGAFFPHVKDVEFLPIKKGKVQLSLLIEKLERFSNNHHPELATGSLVSKTIKSLYEQKTKNKLLFFLTDEFIEEAAFLELRALAKANDLVWFHVFDQYENSLSDEATIRFVDETNNITISPDAGKREQYIKLRIDKLRSFEKSIRSCGGDYLMFDDTDNIFKKLYSFFKKRQSRR